MADENVTDAVDDDDQTNSIEVAPAEEVEKPKSRKNKKDKVTLQVRILSALKSKGGEASVKDITGAVKKDMKHAPKSLNIQVSQALSKMNGVVKVSRGVYKLGDQSVASESEKETAKTKTKTKTKVKKNGKKNGKAKVDDVDDKLITVVKSLASMDDNISDIVNSLLMGYCDNPSIRTKALKDTIVLLMI